MVFIISRNISGVRQVNATYHFSKSGAQCCSGSFQWPRLTMFVLMIAFLLFSQYVCGGQARLFIRDNMEYHVHPAGQQFSLQIKLEYDKQGTVRYHWRDFRGQVLTAPVMLQKGKMATILAPEGHTGYLGLVLEPTTSQLALPDRVAGEAREYGFALLPPAKLERIADKHSRFGMVHADLEDPYLQGWVKTMTWKTASPKWWNSLLEKRRSLGLLELPIIVGDEWKSSDTSPIEQAQLDRLESKIGEYFGAHPATQYWETGIEENLRHRYETQWYWPNLGAKIKAVNSAADKLNADIRLVYQIAELKLQDVRIFLENPVSDNYEVLSLHPYAWPDFPSPEEWLDAYINEVRLLLKSKNPHMPIWFTEVGAPHHGGQPGKLFGYPGKGVRVQGKTPYESAIYMLKMHVIAYSGGVEKIFWYNYIDRNPERNQAENHFGLRDYWGYPKPSYPAYVNLQKQLADRKAGKARRIASSILVYEFDGHNDRVTVAWAFPPANRQVPLSVLLPDTTFEDILDVVDPMGESVPYADTAIWISGDPVFIHSRMRNDNVQNSSMVEK